MKKEWLEQTPKWLEQSNQKPTVLALYKQAQALSSLHNLVNDYKKSTPGDIYASLLEFEQKQAEELRTKWTTKNDTQ